MADVRVGWKGVSQVGYRINNPSWEKNGVMFNKGYTCAREVFVGGADEEQRMYSVECRILSDGMGEPLFECNFKENGPTGTSVCEHRASTAQTAMRRKGWRKLKPLERKSGKDSTSSD